MPKLLCLYCRKQFTRTIGEVNRGRIKFCSNSCSAKFQYIKKFRGSEKMCAKCKKFFSLDKFPHYSKAYCKPCHNYSSNKWFRENRHKGIEVRKNAHLKRTYGISLLDYESMLKKQGGSCAICKNNDTNRKLAVDHCHKTNKIRGLLCGKCNRAIGMLDDNLENAKNLVEYIKQNK